MKHSDGFDQNDFSFDDFGTGDKASMPTSTLADDGSVVGDGHSTEEVEHDYPDPGPRPTEWDGETVPDGEDGVEAKPKEEVTPAATTETDVTEVTDVDYKAKFEELDTQFKGLSALDKLVKTHDGLRAYVRAVLTGGDTKEFEVSHKDIGFDDKLPDDFDPFQAFEDENSPSRKWLLERDQAIAKAALTKYGDTIRSEFEEKNNKTTQENATARETMVAETKGVLDKLGFTEEQKAMFWAWNDAGAFKNAEEYVKASAAVLGISLKAAPKPAGKNGTERVNATEIREPETISIEAQFAGRPNSFRY